MVSQDFSMEPASTVLHQCLISNMNTNPVETEELAYLQFQPNVVPHYFNPLEERLGINSGNGHGLSLTLGSQIPSEFRKDEHANAADSSYLSNGDMVCGGETNSTSRVYNTSNAANNQTFNSMASIITSLQNSPYMKLAQELLDEVVCVSNQAGSGPEKNVKRSMGIATGDTRSFRDGEIMNLNEGDRYSSDENNAVHIKISKLVALLDQLESRYDQYFHQMDMVVSSFESVAGVGAAASYTALTIQAMSKHFSNLRDSIIMQLNASRESLSQDQSRNSDRSSKPKRETLQNLGVIQIRQVWRPLRGLPEESVALLRSWLFDHFLHPYPSDNEKLMLASQTGLTRNQISNWFINARVRLWKPMIEEMYKEEFADDMQD